jgi:hypothetical protein
MPATVLDRVNAAFDHKEGYVPLWAAISNRPVYEHAAGEPVGNAAETSLDDKLRIHAAVFRNLGIELCRAQLWPPDRESHLKGETEWAERPITAANIRSFKPGLPGPAAQKEECAICVRQVLLNAPHTVFAPTIHGPFCRVFEMMGFEFFSYAMVDHPAEIERLMDVFTVYNASRATLYAAEPDVKYMAICDDIAYKGSTMASPDWMRAHWLPRLAQIVTILKKAGKRVIYHSDGKMDALIPDLIGIGVDAINPIEILAGMDLADLKRRFGKDVTFIGGVDCSQLLPFGTPAQIRDEVRRTLDTGAPGGGFVIGDTSQVVPTTPVENLLAFYETVREYNRG